jgi:hypothetical protein
MSQEHPGNEHARWAPVDVEALVMQFGADLDETSKKQLRESLTAATSGDAKTLKKMVPYGPEEYPDDNRVERAFAEALRSQGYKALVVGTRERRPRGAIYGEVRVDSPDGDYLRVIYIKPQDEDEGKYYVQRGKQEGRFARTSAVVELAANGLSSG